MGCWGITAFESDAGLDVIGSIRKELPKDGELMLQSLLEAIRSSKWRELSDPQLGDSHTSPLAVAELIFKIQDGDYAAVDYEEDWAKNDNKFQGLSSFTADKESILWLKDYLTETLAASRRNAENTEHFDKIFKTYNGWFEEKDWIGWQQHMETMIERLGELYARPGDKIELLPLEQMQEDAPVLSM